MNVKKVDNIPIENYFTVRVKEMGNITELMWSNSYISKCNIRKLDKNHYINLETGETKEFAHIQNRACDLKSISKSLGRLRDYLNSNIEDVSKCRWVTLTYRDNVTDTEKLYNDFKLFNRRLRKEIGHYEYIVAMEPQGRGAWHCHVVMIFEDKAPYIQNDLIWKCWSPKGYKAKLVDGKGYDYTQIKKLDDVDNVGAYLTAYLGDMDFEEINKDINSKDGCIDINMIQGLPVKEIEIEENGSKVKKNYLKGARLHMYPPQFNIYRFSRGIKKPVVTYEPEIVAQKKVSSAKLTYEKTIQLQDIENDFEKTINYRYYNKVRKDRQ